MAQEKKYYAFISYKREGVEWMMWLQRKLEAYNMSVIIRNGIDDVKRRVEIFKKFWMFYFMKITFVLCVALLYAPLLLAKPYTQQGISYLYDYKSKTKKPVANVSLTVAYAKGPAISRADGTFTIEFQDFGAGKKLAFEKQPFSQGLMVLNKKEVDGWATFEGKLTLIMCNKKDFDICKQNYYDVGFQSVTKRHEREVAALRRESADYQQRLQELEEKYDHIMDNLRNSADAMARIDQSELDATMQEVLNLYEQGNVEEAMKKLEDMKLEEKFTQTLEKKHKGEKIVVEATEDSIQILKKLCTSVDMYKNSGNWDKAAETLKLMADKLNSYDAISAYAYFCRNQNDFMNAEIYYEKALEICQRHAKDNPKTYDPYVANTLHDLGILYYFVQRFGEAEKMFKLALDIRQRLIQDNPKCYELEMAQTLNNLGLLYSDIQRFKEAEELYKQAMEMYQRLAKTNPKDYELGMAQTQGNLGLLYSKTQRLTEAEDMYKLVLEMFQRLTKDYSKAYEPNVALTLGNLADLYYKTHRLVEAEELFKQMLVIRLRLAKENPRAFEPDVARTLLNLANLYYKTQRLTEAEEMYKQAIEISLRLAKCNFNAYGRYLANLYYNLGILYSDIQRLPEAEEMYKQAIETYKRLANDISKTYEYNVANTLYNLGLLYSDIQKFKEGEKLYKQAMEIYQRLAKVNPIAYEADVASTLINLANLYNKTRKFLEMEVILKQALEIYERLERGNSKVYKPVLATIQNDLAILYRQKQQFTEAEEMFKKSLKNRQQLAKDNPAVYKSVIAQSLGNLSFNTIFLTKYSEAEQLAREGLAVDSTQHWIASNLAASLVLQGRYDEAESFYRQYKDELKDGFLDDFEQFKAAGVISKEREEDVEKIKRMLEE